MAVRAITREQFDRTQPQRLATVALIAEEKAWFAEDGGQVIGTILLDKSEKDWKYIILGREQLGDFGYVGGESGFKNRAIVKEELIGAMERIASEWQEPFRSSKLKLANLTHLG